MIRRSVADVIRVATIVEAVRRIEQPQRRGVTYFSVHDVWLYQAVMDAKVCDLCRKYEISQQWNGNVLRSEFPYLKILDENTIEANVHPNCRCYLVRSIAYEEVALAYPNIYIEPEIKDIEKVKKRLKQVLDKLPPKHIEDIDDITVNRDLMYHGSKVSGLYTPRTKILRVSDETLKGNLSWTQEIIGHEVGHHVYYDDLPQSAQQEWNAFWLENVKDMPSGYAKINAEEGFAECYTYYHNKPKTLPFKSYQKMRDLMHQWG